MASWDDVGAIAAGLEGSEPGTTFGNAAWKVRGKAFVWERPLRAKELDELGPRAPAGATIGVRVADDGEKLALLAEDPSVFLTTAHFDGHPIVLVALERIDPPRLRELIESAWDARRSTK